MVNVDTVLYQCAKFHNFPASGSMGCHRLAAEEKNHANGYNRCLSTFGAWPLIINMKFMTNISGIRLVGGSRCSGRLEVPHGNTWYTVCDAAFDQQDAEVVCRELDCGAPVQVLGAAAFGKGDAQMWTQEIQCGGDEYQFALCPTSPSQFCSHENDVSVVCAETVRLVGGNSRCAGRVEVLHDGEWGTVRDLGWDLSDAAVVCRELGCGEALTAPKSAYFGEGSGSVWISDLQGNESYISLCPTSSSLKQNCTHENAIGLLCSGNREVVKSGLMCLIVTGMKQNSQNVPSLHGVELNVLIVEMLESSALVSPFML
uniref:SRCR domain-containing protein n=1 Tax=Cyprinus carpio carpio TaxID=630221 RepID=A0A9J8BBZ6_CYPCA